MLPTCAQPCRQEPVVALGRDTRPGAVRGDLARVVNLCPDALWCSSERQAELVAGPQMGLKQVSR